MFTATGLTGAYGGGGTAFDLFVDAGTGVGNATQVRVSYDFTGNGSFDRVETWDYFATDPVTGYEHYLRDAAPLSQLARSPTWPAAPCGWRCGTRSATTPATLGTGNQSRVVLPFS